MYTKGIINVYSFFFAFPNVKNDSKTLIICLLHIFFMHYTVCTFYIITQDHPLSVKGSV